MLMDAALSPQQQPQRPMPASTASLVAASLQASEAHAQPASAVRGGRGGGRAAGRGRGRGRVARKPAAAKAAQAKRSAAAASAPPPAAQPHGDASGSLGMPVLPPGVKYSVTDSRNGVRHVVNDGSGGPLSWSKASSGAGPSQQRCAGPAVPHHNPLDAVPEELRPYVLRQMLTMQQSNQFPWLSNPAAVSLYITSITQQVRLLPPTLPCSHSLRSGAALGLLSTASLSFGQF